MKGFLSLNRFNSETVKYRCTQSAVWYRIRGGIDMKKITAGILNPDSGDGYRARRGNSICSRPGTGGEWFRSAG